MTADSGWNIFSKGRNTTNPRMRNNNRFFVPFYPLTQSKSDILFLHHCKTYVFKGSLTRDFRLQVFLWISVPQGPKYSIGAVLNFFEIRRDIREWIFIAGVNDTSDKLCSGFNNTGEKFIAGVVDTGNKSLSQGNNQKA